MFSIFWNSNRFSGDCFCTNLTNEWIATSRWFLVVTAQSRADSSQAKKSTIVSRVRSAIDRRSGAIDLFCSKKESNSLKVTE